MTTSFGQSSSSAQSQPALGIGLVSRSAARPSLADAPRQGANRSAASRTTTAIAGCRVRRPRSDSAQIGGQVEAGRSVERSSSGCRGDDPRHAIRRGSGRPTSATRYQTPAFRTSPSGSRIAVDRLVAAAVLDLHPPGPPRPPRTAAPGAAPARRPGTSRRHRDGTAPPDATPARAARAGRAARTLSRAAATTVPEPQLRGRPGQTGQEQGLRLVGGHAGQPGPIAVDQADAAVRPALGEDRDAGALRASTSRWMVRTETSSSSASSPAVRPPRVWRSSSRLTSRLARIGAA